MAATFRRAPAFRRFLNLTTGGHIMYCVTGMKVYLYHGTDASNNFIEVVLRHAIEMAKQAPKAFRIEEKRRSRRGGGTLRPGRETPFWNELRKQMRPHLRKYGTQANLGRLLGLPRQRINAFVTGGGEMPDAERTLQLLVWLTAVQSGRPPS